MITIINYGLGNVGAFATIYKRLNIPHRIALHKNDLHDATKLILPGVGAFDHAMTLLQQSGMRESLDKMVLQEKIPVIGICVGMQMLAHSSEEGKLSGLGWIDGDVKRFDDAKLTKQQPLPHMGWNTLHITKNNLLTKDLGKTPRFYFLHSYYFVCNSAQDSIATAKYGNEFSAIIQSNNIYGIQCHPEKSHQNGVQFLKNFGEL